MAWSSEDDAVIVRHYRKDKTAAEIAAIVGRPRGSIITRAAALGLAERNPSTISRLAEAAARRPAPRARAVKTAPTPAPARPVTTKVWGGGKYIQPQHNSPWRTCQWIDAPTGLGDPPRCGCSTVAGSSWCATHYARVFTPKERRSEITEPAEQRREAA